MKSDFRSKSFKRNSVEFFFCLQLSEKPDEKLYCGWPCDGLAAHPEGSTDTPCSSAHFKISVGTEVFTCTTNKMTFYL